MDFGSWMMVDVVFLLNFACSDVKMTFCLLKKSFWCSCASSFCLIFLLAIVLVVFFERCFFEELFFSRIFLVVFLFFRLVLVRLLFFVYLLIIYSLIDRLEARRSSFVCSRKEKALWLSLSSWGCTNHSGLRPLMLALPILFIFWLRIVGVYSLSLINTSLKMINPRAQLIIDGARIKMSARLRIREARPVRGLLKGN